MVCTIGVLKEASDNRVLLDPEIVKRLVKLGVAVNIQKSAGLQSFFSDTEYKNAGANIVTAAAVFESDILCSVNLPSLDTIKKIKQKSNYITILQAHSHIDAIKVLQENKVTVFALELIPRISRAQSMDVLSSQASAAGYKAALNAASHYRGFFPMLTTAAGTIRPVKAVVVGAGVAGLQAIATCKRLGAIVESYDIRPAAKEQVESLGAKMIDTGVNAEGEGGYARSLTDEEKQKQSDVLAQHIAKANVVITTAAIPGRPSPKIINTAMVDSMQDGSVIVDLAAEGGGNCEKTVSGKIIKHGEVTIDGTLQLPSDMSKDASQMLAKNIFNFISPFIKEGEFTPDFSDQVLKDCLVLQDGNICHDGIKKIIGDSK